MIEVVKWYNLCSETSVCQYARRNHPGYLYGKYVYPHLYWLSCVTDARIDITRMAVLHKAAVSRVTNDATVLRLRALFNNVYVTIKIAIIGRLN